MKKPYNVSIKLSNDSYPNDSDTHVEKGYTLCDLDRQEEAMECFKKAIELNPIMDETAYNGKYFILRNLDKNEEALECLEKIIALNSNDPEAHYNKGFKIFHFIFSFKDALNFVRVIKNWPFLLRILIQIYNNFYCFNY